MSNNTVADNQSKALQNKLNAAIAARSSLEEDFKAQSSLLIDFISKLSQLSKGMDLTIDNRLAQLRVLLTKSAPIADIELKITEISKLLQQHTRTNEKNINHLHAQFNEAGQSLQKVNGLPGDLRRNLRKLLLETQSSKDSLTQYVPLLSQLLTFYNTALRSKTDASVEQTTNPTNHNATTKSSSLVNKVLIKKVSRCLNKLYLSTQHKKSLSLINKKLLQDTCNDAVLQRIIEVFDVIAADLQHERNSAKKFLTTLNETLTSVQTAVSNTLSTCEEAQHTNNEINLKLQQQLLDMTGTVKQAMSLEQVKTDISGKLTNIALTLEQKNTFEQKSQQHLTSQLNEMTKKVKELESQSQYFESKLAEQQRKSMQDALTKLANRAAFDEHFTQVLFRFQQAPFDLALAVIDIDNFKSINDTYGHAAGDKTLQVIANTIQKKVSKGAFVARYGGEEFVIIYAQHKKAELINELNLINNSVAQLPFKFKNTKVSITLSIGVTHITAQDNIHTTFERADEAMYKAKAQGKNQVIYSQ